jgi:hypothetical protein
MNFSELAMLFEVANINQFPFSIQNTFVNTYEAPTIFTKNLEKSLKKKLEKKA